MLCIIINIAIIIPWVVELALYLFLGFPSIDFFVVKRTDYFCHCDFLIQFGLLRHNYPTMFIFLFFLDRFNGFDMIFPDKTLVFIFVYEFMVDLLSYFHDVEGEAILAIFVSSESERLLLECFVFFLVLDFKNPLSFFVKFQIFIFNFCTFGAEVGILYF